MSKAKYNRKVIEKSIRLDQKNLDRINLMGTTVESLSEDELELEIPANRPDLLSTGGFLRAFKSFEGKETGLREYKRSTSNNYIVTVDKNVKDIWPYTACAVVEGLKLNPEDVREIITLQEKLTHTVGRNRKKCGLGVYPLNKISFPIRYEARSPTEIKFVPLGANKEMTGEQILQKHPTGIEYAHVIKSKKAYPIFIDAKKRIMSMPPIINSEETGRIDEKTTDVFIECSGTDQKAIEQMLIIFTTELADRGGKIQATKIKDTKEIITPSFEPKKIKINKDRIEKIIGVSLTEKEMEKLLSKMGHDYKAGKISVPSWRADVIHEVDLAEDVAIAYGYDKLIPIIPSVSTAGQRSEQTRIKEQIRDVLNGLGLIEVSSLHFITKEEAEREEIDAILIEDPRTEYSLLRPNLTIPILRTLSTNKDTEYPQEIYELGKVFNKNRSQESNIKEEERLAIALTPSNFTRAKQVLDYLTKNLGINYHLEEKKEQGYVEGRGGAIMINDQHAGHIGEIHPQTLNRWKLRMPLSVIELTLPKY